MKNKKELIKRIENMENELQILKNDLNHKTTIELKKYGDIEIELEDDSDLITIIQDDGCNIIGIPKNKAYQLIRAIKDAMGD